MPGYPIVSLLACLLVWFAVLGDVCSSAYRLCSLACMLAALLVSHGWRALLHYWLICFPHSPLNVVDSVADARGAEAKL